MAGSPPRVARVVARMPAMPMQFARRPQRVVARIVPERRRHTHTCTAMTPFGRFMRASKGDYPCRPIDSSAGGAAVGCEVAVPEGERIVASFDHFGGLEGEVVREFAGGFAFRIAARRRKREKLAGELTCFATRAELSEADGRRHSAAGNKTTRLS
jgi:hypothetical protein